MNPLLSIIIPNYNHTHRLPTLLANIAGQKFQDFEIILVDDCSDEPLDDLVETWQAKGLSLRLFRNAFRQYTKNTRLNGVEQARGDLITFLDADDLLVDDTTLGFHVVMLRETKAELLQFQVASYINDKIDLKLFEWTKPLGEHLVGPQIFERYVQENLRSHLVYGKIATRGLWQKCLEPARASSVRRYQEDLLLCSLLFFHARNYVGSDKIGYTRTWQDKNEEKAIGRIASLYAMLTEFLPYIERNGASQDTATTVRASLLERLQNNAMIASGNAMLDGRVLLAHCSPQLDTLLHEIEQHCSMEIFAKALLAAFPILQIQELKMKNELLQMEKLEVENKYFKRADGLME